MTDTKRLFRSGFLVAETTAGRLQVRPPMQARPIRQIEKWFADHEGDGEYLQHRRTAPYSVVGPAGPTSPVLYTTKPAILCGVLDRSKDTPGFAIVGRGGLPSADDLKWITHLIGSRQVFYVGDMDPVDLTIFAWLRARLHPRPIGHLGVNDKLLEKLPKKLSDQFIIGCAPSERDALGLFGKLLPDYRQVVGQKVRRRSRARGENRT